MLICHSEEELEFLFYQDLILFFHTFGVHVGLTFDLCMAVYYILLFRSTKSSSEARRRRTRFLRKFYGFREARDCQNGIWPWCTTGYMMAAFFSKTFCSLA